MGFSFFGLKEKEDTPVAGSLSDPRHPASKHLKAAADIVDRCVRIEVAGDQSMLQVSAGMDDLTQLVQELDAGIQLCPDDLNLAVAKASALHVCGQFKSAEEELDKVLAKDPQHFEARQWKDHWESWLHPLRFPVWNEKMTALQPAMAAHLRAGHRVQIVREGFQKVIAIVAVVQGPPFHPQTKIRVAWVLSETPSGPLLAYYVKIIEPQGEPSTMEAFVPLFKPTLFAPMEGFYLAQQLALCPYAFVALVNNGGVQLNCKLEWGPKTLRQIQKIQADVAGRKSFLAQADFQRAMQWHMNNFDMAKVEFE
ncbi:MAG: hypothetical protein PHX83_04110 [Acidobacteriia bacterium]|nr:hypothetical protein [Terriglobia bacterium]